MGAAASPSRRNSDRLSLASSLPGDLEISRRRRIGADCRGNLGPADGALHLQGCDREGFFSSDGIRRQSEISRRKGSCA